MRNSLEFAHNNIVSLQKTNKDLQTAIQSLTDQMHTVKEESKLMKEVTLDLQTRSMHYNLIFTGILEKSSNNPEALIKDFMSTHLKLPPDTIQNITFHRVHHLGKHTDNGPRPIMAKFEHLKQKELVKSKGKEMKGTTFGLNDQYPREINE